MQAANTGRAKIRSRTGRRAAEYICRCYLHPKRLDGEVKEEGGRGKGQPEELREVPYRVRYCDVLRAAMQHQLRAGVQHSAGGELLPQGGEELRHFRSSGVLY